MQKITPFLWFDKDCETAMQFYVDTFNSAPHSKKNSRVVRIKRYPDGVTEGPMAGMGGKVLTGVFEIDGQTFMGLDGGPYFKPNEAVSFLVECKDQAEIDYFWDVITRDGGAESQCGWCKDKYGFSWQIGPSLDVFMNGPDAEASARAMQALMGMKKIVIAELDRAYRGEV